MQFADDPVEVVTVSVIIVLFVGLLVGHMVCAGWVGLKRRGRVGWMGPARLAGLAALTTLVWFLLASAISVMNLLDASRALPAIAAYAGTFGLPFEWNLPGAVIGLSVVQTPLWLRLTCTAGAVALICYLLAGGAAATARGVRLLLERGGSV